MSSNYIIRQATISDRDEVTSILKEGEYEGDYLPDKYISFMEDPNYYGYVYIVEGKIVGFSGVYIIDEGQAGVMRSARMKKEFRGQGVLRSIGQHIVAQHPYLKRSVHFSSVNMEMILATKKTTPAFSLIATLKHAFYQGVNIVSNVLPAYDGLNKESRVEVISESLLHDLFSKKTQYPKVFNINRVFVDLVPFKPMKNNIPGMLASGSGIISCRDEPMKTLLTFESHFRLQSGEIYCNVHVHGTVNEYFEQHIFSHIQAFRGRIAKMFTIAIISVAEEDSDLVERRMVSLGLKRAPTTQYSRNEAIVFEFLISRLSNKL